MSMYEIISALRSDFTLYLDSLNKRIMTIQTFFNIISQQASQLQPRQGTKKHIQASKLRVSLVVILVILDEHSSSQILVIECLPMLLL